MEVAVAIVLAAGSGDRLGSPEPKAFVTLGGIPLVRRAVEAALDATCIGRAIVVVPPGSEQRATALLADRAADVSIVAGGEDRAASTRRGLAALGPDDAIVVCHDAARALATSVLFDRVVAALRADAAAGGAIPVVPVVDTVKRVEADVVIATEPREALALAQTPQAFRRAVLVEAHDAAERAGVVVTDDARALELVGARVIAVPGEETNRKITTSDDLALAEAVIARG